MSTRANEAFFASLLMSVSFLAKSDWGSALPTSKGAKSLCVCHVKMRHSRRPESRPSQLDLNAVAMGQVRYTLRKVTSASIQFIVKHSYVRDDGHKGMKSGGKKCNWMERKEKQVSQSLALRCIGQGLTSGN